MDVASWLADRTPAFQDLHARIGALVRARWPMAHLEVTGEGSYEMPSYVIPIENPPAADTWKGTMPRDVFIVAPTEKKAGITIHVWHPNHPYLLKDHAETLAQAGYKPMVGCLQWNRKTAPDLDAFAALLDSVA